MLQAFNAEEAKQALQALVAQTEKKITLTKTENNELLGSFEDLNELNKVPDPKDGNNLYISASDGYTVSLSGEFDYFDNHIKSLKGDIDISRLEIVSHEDRGDRVLVASSSLREEIYENLNLENKEGDSLPTLKFGLTHDKDLGLKHFLNIYEKYNKSEKLQIDAHFISMDGSKLVDVENYTLFKEDGNTAKANDDASIRSFEIDKLVEFAKKYKISDISNLIIYGNAKKADVDWQLTNIIFEGDMSQLTNTSETHLKGIVYFKGLPYYNRTTDKGQVVEGAVRLDELSSSIKLVNDSYSILDVRNIDKEKLDAYNQDNKYIHRGIGGMYFNEQLKDRAGNNDLLYSKFTEGADGGYINNEYFGDRDRQDSFKTKGFITSKKPRTLSEFEYYGIHSKFENAAVKSYSETELDNFTHLEKSRLESDRDVKTIAKVTTLCPLC